MPHFPSLSPFRIVDDANPKTHGKRCRTIRTADDKIAAVIHWDYTHCRGVRGDFSHFPDIDNAWANCELFVAAPELLHACELAESFFAEQRRMGLEVPELDVLRAAIARARGQTAYEDEDDDDLTADDLDDDFATDESRARTFDE